ncbi:MAG: ABC transporter ATP-binding protein [Gordonia sp. (in: high G+C Gram-positive bacteria)]
MSIRDDDGVEIIFGETPALDVSGLAVDFGSARPAVRDISIRVDRAQILALVGESGSGKTITAKAAIGLLPAGARATGSVKVDGQEILGADEKTLARLRGGAVAMVFQEPQTALNPVRTVGWQIAEALRAHRKVGRRQARTRAIELLRQVEIPEPERRVDSYPHQLSGGQKQRVVIALALANDPVLLLADEPTTALDVSVQAEILDLLRRIRDRTRAGILLITHNLGVVADIADRVVVVRHGEVVERGDVYDLFARPTADYTKQLLAAVPRLPTTPADVEAAVEPGAARPVLEVTDLDVVYPSRGGQPPFRALDRVTLRIDPGEILGVVGESGSGKTTLGRAIGGLLPISAGKIVIDGTDLVTADRAVLRAVRRELAFVPQDPAASLDPRYTVGESIIEPLQIHGDGTATERRARALELLDAVHLPAEIYARYPDELSGGQRQRVALARALVLTPRLVIADEPTSALDVSVQARVLELFTQLQQQLGFAALFISHDLAVIEQVADRVAIFQRGRIVETGPARQVFTQPTQPYTRDLVDAVPYPDPVVQRRADRYAKPVSGLA